MKATQLLQATAIASEMMFVCTTTWVTSLLLLSASANCTMHHEVLETVKGYLLSQSDYTDNRTLDPLPFKLIKMAILLKLQTGIGMKERHNRSVSLLLTQISTGVWQVCCGRQWPIGPKG